MRWDGKSQFSPQRSRTVLPGNLKARYDPGMSIVFTALAVAFAAFCVWLTVRIVNRREKWTKWTLTAVLAVAFLAPPVSYPWAKGVLMTSPRAETMTELITLCSLFERGLFSCPDFIGRAYLPYYVWWVVGSFEFLVARRVVVGCYFFQQPIAPVFRVASPRTVMPVHSPEERRSLPNHCEEAIPCRSAPWR